MTALGTGSPVNCLVKIDRLFLTRFSVCSGDGRESVLQCWARTFNDSESFLSRCISTPLTMTTVLTKSNEAVEADIFLCHGLCVDILIESNRISLNYGKKRDKRTRVIIQNGIYHKFTWYETREKLNWTQQGSKNV